jgi:23S rRNA pseudouridine1911/1915/1917 synthase
MEEDELSFLVNEDGVGQRADKYLTSVCEDLSRSRLQGLIADGQVSLNGKPLKASVKLELGDELIVNIPPPIPSTPEAQNIPLSVVYEDEDLLVIDKAAGMVVHPGAGNWTGTLVNALLHHCGESLSGIGGVIRPGIVHRLDKETSGLMIVAKNDHAHHHLAEQLSDRSLSRVYEALVFGVPLPIKGVVSRPIGRHRHNRQKMSVMSSTPRDAVTHYHVLENYRDVCALVECALETGRTHQIRVHMEALGYPLIGDPLYGTQQNALISKLKKARYNDDIIEKTSSFPRQFLHARHLVFIHPTTEDEMHFESSMPEDMLNILDSLRK